MYLWYLQPIAVLFISSFQVKITHQKQDLGQVKSKCGTMSNLKHTPRGGDRKVCEAKIVYVSSLTYLTANIRRQTLQLDLKRDNFYVSKICR